MTAYQFNRILAELGLGQSELSRLFQRGLRTVQHWAAGTSPVPPEAAFLLRALRDQKLTTQDVEGYHD